MMLLIWIGLLALSGGKDNAFLGAAAAIVGLMFGVLMIAAVGAWLGIVLIFLNIYILYKSIMEGEKK
jgi:predicted membrane protein